jgi:hypothetical protein
MSIEQAVERYLPALRRTAEKIEREVIQQGSDKVSSANAGTPAPDSRDSDEPPSA